MYLENDISFSDIVNLIGILRRNIDDFELTFDEPVTLRLLDDEDRQLLLKIIEG